MGNTVDRDLGFKRILKELRAANGSYTKIGIQEGTRHQGEGESEMAVIALAQEFGTSDGHIPERSFIRTATDENTPKIKQASEKLLTHIYKGTVTAKQALGLLGSMLQDDIQKKIQDIDTPPNAPATIAIKGSSNPLIDTRQMLNSVRHVEVMK